MARAVAFLTERHRKQQQILCLPPATGDLPETGGVIVSSPALPTRKPIEHCGHIYQEKVIRAYSVNGLPDDDDNSDGSTNSSETQSTPKFSKSETEAKRANAASSLASKIAVGSDDLYELLELGEKRWHATADDIKKSFRRSSLTYHPDKIAHLGEEARVNSEAHFKAVMKAYDILSDKKKRAAYDSIDDVDDSIPSERDGTSTPERFFEKFGACFALNARWSLSDRVPSLGTDDSDLNDVDKFYDFWYAFKSWRDFSFDLEYDTDQAECREEKRWMERQNGKHVKARKLEESARIRRLVDLAFKHDPRLQRERTAAKAKKDKQKEEKRKVAEEKAKKEQEKVDQEKKEMERKEVEDKEKRAVAKKHKQNARQIMRKTRQRLRATAKEVDLISSERGGFNVEKMCMEGTVESIDAVSDLLGAVLKDGTRNLLEKALEIMEKAVVDPLKPLHGATSTESTDEAGNNNRKDDVRISDSASSSTSTTSTVDSKSNGHIDNSDEAKSPSKSPSKPKASIATHWTADELSLLSKGVAKFPGGTRERWQKLSDVIGTKTPEEVLSKVNESRASKIGSASRNVKAGFSAKKDEALAFERYQEKKKGSTTKPATTSSSSTTKPISSSSSPKMANGDAAATPVSAPTATGGSQPPNMFLFTPKEQSMFEGALKKFPVSSGDMRWKKVSGVVGRSADECQQRFMELITYYQAKKRKQ